MIEKIESGFGHLMATLYGRRWIRRLVVIAIPVSLTQTAWLMAGGSWIGLTLAGLGIGAFMAQYA